MLDINNKLHALVDEFVSNLTSECDSLANNASTPAFQYVAHDSAIADGQTQRPSNRTTADVLNGLKRPTSAPSTSSMHKEGKSHVQNVKNNLQGASNRNKESSKNLRPIQDMKAKSAKTLELDDPYRLKSDDTDIEDILFTKPEDRGNGRNHVSPKGRHVLAVELLSSDSASDSSLPPRAKYSARRRGTQQPANGRDTNSQGRSRRTERRSPSRSPFSSPSTNYSYEEDTPHLGGTSPHASSPFPKLRWPLDPGTSLEDVGKGSKNAMNNEHGHTEYQNKHERKKIDMDVSLEEGDKPNGEDTALNPIGTDSEGEELPVLPKVPVKRKATNQPKVSEKRTQKGRTKTSSPQTKKQRTPHIDASVITKLEFGRRPENCVSGPTLSM